MERRIQTPSKFLFPNLETLYWYAAKNLSYSLQGTVRWEIILASQPIVSKVHSDHGCGYGLVSV